MTLNWDLISIEELGAFANDWDRLNRESANMPFLDCQVIRYACRDFGTGTERLAVCRDGGSVVAASVVTPVRRGVWQTFQPSQVALGIWLQRHDLDLGLLIRTLRHRLPGLRAMLGVTRLDPDFYARPRNSNVLETVDYIETARVTIQSSFDEYWRARGSNLRQNLRKQRNRLARENVAIRLEQIDDPGRISGAVDEYGDLESRGWKGAEGSALHSGNEQGRFFRDAMRYHAEKGEGCAYRYFLGDRLVATDLCVRRDGVLTILKTAFDSTEKALSPSLLMKEHVFRELFSDGRTRRIEFYGRVMDWHRRFSDESRVLYHASDFRWGWLRKLRDSTKKRARPSEAGQPVAESPAKQPQDA